MRTHPPSSSWASRGKSGVAATLRIHEKTVAHRLRGAEAELGAPIHERRADVEAALLVHAARTTSRGEPRASSSLP